MLIWVLLSEDLVVEDMVLPSKKCKEPAVKQLLADYCEKKGGNWKSIFWGFPDLAEDDYVSSCRKISEEMECREGRVWLLDVPDDLVLKINYSRFFTIFVQKKLKVSSCEWESIYDLDEPSAKPLVILPFIKEEWVVDSWSLASVLEPEENPIVSLVKKHSRPIVWPTFIAFGCFVAWVILLMTKGIGVTTTSVWVLALVFTAIATLNIRHNRRVLISAIKAIDDAIAEREQSEKFASSVLEPEVEQTDYVADYWKE